METECASRCHGEEAVHQACCAPPPPSTTRAVLLVGKCVPRETGNATTLDRLARTVRDGGWASVTRDPDSLPHVAGLHDLLKQHNVTIVLGLHAYRSAQVLLSCQEAGVPYLIMFGGTDVNECVKDAAKKAVMERVVAGAKSIIAFNDSTRSAALQVWPTLDPAKIWLMPQAVQVDPDPDFDVLSFLAKVEAAHIEKTVDQETSVLQTEEKNSDGLAQSTTTSDRIACDGYTCKENVETSEFEGGTTQNEILMETNSAPCKESQELPTTFQPLVLLVAGLRPVKDVLYLTEAFSKWQRARGGRGRFLILGPSLDPRYAAHVRAQVNSLSGVRVCPSLPPRECQAVIRSATVLVNSSLSESMPNSILEAMALGTPVIARANHGNASLVSHCHTGLLFSGPDAFIQELERLMQESGLRDSLVTAAKEQLSQCHSLQQEKDTLLSILDKTAL